jgi:hypothetical protein
MKARLIWKDTYKKGVPALKDKLIEFVNESDSRLEMVERAEFDNNETHIVVRIIIKTEK